MLREFFFKQEALGKRENNKKKKYYATDVRVSNMVKCHLINHDQADIQQAEITKFFRHAINRDWRRHIDEISENLGLFWN